MLEGAGLLGLLVGRQPCPWADKDVGHAGGSRGSDPEGASVPVAERDPPAGKRATTTPALLRSIDAQACLESRDWFRHV